MAFGWFFSVLFASVCLFAPTLEAKTPKEVIPYLMPNDHPIKAALDELFSSSRVLFNCETLRAAGFKNPKPRHYTRLIVSKHPAFPGYYFKIFLDTQRYYGHRPEYAYWTDRVKASNAIRKAIVERGLTAEFKAPRKWVYQLPPKPKPREGYATKHYILVTEDMDIHTDEESCAFWASDAVTPKLLSDLYGLIKDLGLRDCIKADNIPLSHDGRIAFIDTQYLNNKDLELKKFTPYLSEMNQIYWKTLIHK